MSRNMESISDWLRSSSRIAISVKSYQRLAPRTTAHFDHTPPLTNIETRSELWMDLTGFVFEHNDVAIEPRIYSSPELLLGLSAGSSSLNSSTGKDCDTMNAYSREGT